MATLTNNEIHQLLLTLSPKLQQHLAAVMSAPSKSNKTKFFTITKSGGVRYYADRREVLLWIAANNDGPLNCTLTNRLTDAIDVAPLRKIYVDTNQHEISRLKLLAAANRKPRGTKPVGKLKIPTPVGTQARLPRQLCIDLVHQNAKNIMLFTEQPKWLCQAALRTASSAISYLLDPTDADYEFIVTHRITGISMIPLTEFTTERVLELKLLSLKASKGRSIPYIRGLNEEIKVLAISLYEKAINHIGKPSDKLKRLHAMKWKL